MFGDNYSSPNTFDMEHVRREVAYALGQKFGADTPSPADLVNWFVDDVLRHEGLRHSAECAGPNARKPRSDWVCQCKAPPVFRLVFGERAWWFDA